ncbi:TraG/TraD/VirD4 family protein [Streptomyces axinellae]|uniref:TraD/TraG TraM recognition site domain-containing protein n=1 Tax=Streptomyces axinellae TaxID=552788 RepID=A0ABP6C068_9ACTN
MNPVSPLTTAVTEDLLDVAETHALTSPAGRLDPPLLAALDEAPNVAPIPSLRKRVADGRGRGITVIYGLQGWASARARFGEDTANEPASFTNRIIVFGGAKDPAFLKDMSDLCGQVKRVRKTKTTTGGDRCGGHSTATHRELEPVLRGYEIRGLDDGQALVLADSLPPVLTRLDGMWSCDSWPEIQAHIQDLRAANEQERRERATAKRRQSQAHAATWASRKGASA